MEELEVQQRTTKCMFTVDILKMHLTKLTGPSIWQFWPTLEKAGETGILLRNCTLTERLL